MLRSLESKTRKIVCAINRKFEKKASSVSDDGYYQCIKRITIKKHPEVPEYMYEDTRYLNLIKNYLIKYNSLVYCYIKIARQEEDKITYIMSAKWLPEINK